MAGKAIIIVEGNVGGEPEMKVTPNGVITTTFSLANTPRFQKDGEWRDGDTTWFRCVTWNRTAEAAAEHLHKGRPIQVQGRLTNRRYTDKDGNERTSLEINVDTFGVIPKASGGKYDRESVDNNGNDVWGDSF